jgi:hypothetical protein
VVGDLSFKWRWVLSTSEHNASNYGSGDQVGHMQSSKQRKDPNVDGECNQNYRQRDNAQENFQRWQVREAVEAVRAEAAEPFRRQCEHRKAATAKDDRTAQECHEQSPIVWIACQRGYRRGDRRDYRPKQKRPDGRVLAVLIEAAVEPI